jgi:macrolide transport system ATP-binding/permease protein
MIVISNYTVANMVAQRTREIGIRMALGSTIFQAMLQIGWSGAAASVSGMVFGLILSFGALRVMRSVIYGVDVYDMTMLVTVTVILVVISLLGMALPILKIAKIDPANTLREE